MLSKNNKHKMQMLKTIKIHNIVIISTILLLITSPAAYAPSIGVMPSEIDLGQVSKGDDVVGVLYLSASSDKIVRLAGSYIAPVSNRWYRTYISEYSEEDISRWMEFKEKTMEVDATKSFTLDIGGVSTRANKKVEFIMHIPKNAEPGYHAGSINFYPITEAAKGTEVTMYAIARPNFVFRVNGQAIRRGEITKIEALRESDNKANIIIYFKNTGTNTMNVDTTKSYIKIYNSDDEIRAEIPVSGVRIRPGEVGMMGVGWSSNEGIKDGKYKVSAVINYRNDEASKSEFVTIPSMIAANQIQGQQINLTKSPVEAILSPTTCSTNWTTIFVISLLIGLIIYWRLQHATIKDILLMSGGVFFILTIINYLLFCYRSTVGVIAIIVLLAVAIYYRIPGKRY